MSAFSKSNIQVLYRSLTTALAITVLLATMSDASAEIGVGGTGLLQLLERQGWQAQSATDGSLIFRPPESPSPQDRDEAAQNPTATEQIKVDTQEVRRLLLQRGWRTETDSAGNTLLIPTRTSTTTRQVAQGAPPQNAQETRRPKVTDRSLNEFERALSSTGWRVRPEPDGSMTVYPPQQTAEALGSHPRGTVAEHGYCDGVVPIAVTQQEITLPIDSPAKAARLASDWIASFGHADDVPGRIRRINRVYSVSIVEGEYPHHLRNQLIIRRESGAIVAIY